MIDLDAAQARAEQAMALADKAAPARWRVQNTPGKMYGKVFQIFCAVGNVLTGDQLKPNGISIGGARRNAEFIADARISVPDLGRLVLDLVARAREVEGQLADAHQNIAAFMAEEGAAVSVPVCEYAVECYRSRQQKAPPHE